MGSRVRRPAPARRAGLLDAAAGVVLGYGPAHESVSSWLDAHPGACLVALLLFGVAASVADSWG